MSVYNAGDQGSMVWEDPLEKEMAIHSNTIAWKIPWTEEPGRATVHGVAESDTTERLHLHLHFSHGREKFFFFLTDVHS